MKILSWLSASVVVVASTLVMAGCATSGMYGNYDWRAAVSQQASFDHQCPPQNIAVVRDNGDPMARAVELIVCGQPRMYRDIGGTQIYVWQDVTAITSGGTPTVAPGSYGQTYPQGTSPQGGYLPAVPQGQPGQPAPSATPAGTAVTM